MPASRRCTSARLRVALLAATTALLASVATGAGCALEPDDAPGCRADAECGDGFTCRAGACFRLTTSASPPRDPADASDAAETSDGSPE